MLPYDYGFDLDDYQIGGAQNGLKMIIRNCKAIVKRARRSGRRQEK
jgi:hypothetical protein